MTDPTPNTWLEVAKALPNLITTVYGDLARPGVRKVGKALATTLDLANTVLLPVRLLNERSQLVFKRNMERFRERLAEIPDEQVVDAPPEIGVPVIEKLSYTTDEDIADLFINLLSSAASSATAGAAHPSFLSAVNALSGDEARILAHLRGRSVLPYFYLRRNLKDGSGGTDHARFTTGLEHDIPLSHPQNARFYMENFMALGILRDEYPSHLTAEHHYEALLARNQGLIDNFNASIKDPYASPAEVTRSYFTVTNYGQLFTQACTRSK